MEIDLQAIARARVSDPMNTWPDHTGTHRRTLMGSFLADYDCLRCWLEKAATEKATKPQETT